MRDGWRRFSRDRLAVVGLALVVLIVGLAVLAPVLAPAGYDHQVYENAYLFPSIDHPMGTDGLGREVWARVLYGAQVSLFVGIVSQVWAFLIGVVTGGLAGYFGGWVDYTIMRIVDATAAFPSLLFAILIIAVIGSGLWPVLIAIGITNWVTTARITRAQFLQLRQSEFITAARVVGLSNRRIVIRHLFPNSASPLIITLTLGIPAAIFTEAGLSFLGLGISPPVPSWGQMVGEGYQYLGYYWYLAVFPAIALALLMLGFTWAGDGLRDAFDPHEGG